MKHGPAPAPLPQVILHNATLEGIAAARPRSRQQLRGISSIGDKKLERYGDALIEIVPADYGD